MGEPMLGRICAPQTLNATGFDIRAARNLSTRTLASPDDAARNIPKNTTVLISVVRDIDTNRKPAFWCAKLDHAASQTLTHVVISSTLSPRYITDR